MYINDLSQGHYEKSIAYIAQLKSDHDKSQKEVFDCHQRSSMALEKPPRVHLRRLKRKSNGLTASTIYERVLRFPLSSQSKQFLFHYLFSQIRSQASEVRNYLKSLIELCNVNQEHVESPALMEKFNLSDMFLSLVHSGFKGSDEASYALHVSIESLLQGLNEGRLQPIGVAQLNDYGTLMKVPKPDNSITKFISSHFSLKAVEITESIVLHRADSTIKQKYLDGFLRSQSENRLFEEGKQIHQILVQERKQKQAKLRQAMLPTINLPDDADWAT